VDFSSDDKFIPMGDILEEKTGSEIVKLMGQMRHWRVLFLQGESAPSAQKFVTLSEKRDRFGDPFAHIQYASSDFDRETYRFGRQIFDKFVAATAADDAVLDRVDRYDNAAHHVGTCRMGVDERDSVVDGFGRVHGSPNLFVIGGSNFAGIGAVQPTLTMVALAIRSAHYIVDQVL
jgi:choline dehydrogenase-like flavoprotein